MRGAQSTHTHVGGCGVACPSKSLFLSLTHSLQESECPRVMEREDILIMLQKVSFFFHYCRDYYLWDGPTTINISSCHFTTFIIISLPVSGRLGAGIPLLLLVELRSGTGAWHGPGDNIDDRVWRPRPRKSPLLLLLFFTHWKNSLMSLQNLNIIYYGWHSTIFTAASASPSSFFLAAFI